MADLQHTIQNASRGDRNALQELLERYLPDLRSFARLNMGPLALHESAEDVVQSVCRQVLGDLETVEYRGEAAFRQWLLAACTNRMRDHQKHALREKRDARRKVELRDSAAEHLATFSSPSGELMRREELAELQTALDRLPDEYRDVVSLSRLLGMPHSQIAEHIGKSEGATRMLLHRAVARLGIELAALRSTEPGPTPD